MSASFKITDLLPSRIRVPASRASASASTAPPPTTQFYANEAEVGEALRATSIPRDQIFITTKILSPAASVEATYDKLLASVHKIGGADGYVDLFLIHSSSSGSAGRKLLWQALEKLYAEGKTKSIGVSNFGVGHIEEMRAYAQVFPPHVNQIERVIDEYCQKNGIIVEAYSPIVRNYKANDPALVEIAKRYAKSTQQVLIRYALQKGWVPLPKTDTPERIVANADVFDFDLSVEDMALLDSFDQGSAGAIVEAVDNE
ncbi:Aldo/keto reductase [Penicillium expansum]|nr:Aldo/keto reductase [Penicillium expansum]